MYSLTHKSFSVLAALILASVSLLIGIQPARAVSGPVYDAGTAYYGSLLPDYSTIAEDATRHKGWVKVSNQGETLYAKDYDQDCNVSPRQVWLLINTGSGGDQNLVLNDSNNRSAKFGGIKIYVESIFCGPSLQYFAKVQMYYEGYSPTPTPIPSLSAPSNLTITKRGVIRLTWQDNSNNETGFKIERADNCGRSCADKWKEIATVGANVTVYDNYGVPCGNYYYRVRAYNTSGNSGYSNKAWVAVYCPFPG